MSGGRGDYIKGQKFHSLKYAHFAWNMTIEYINEIVSKGESRTLELKKTSGELKDGMHSLCAFLNTDGGILIFGVAPTSLKIEGQIVSDKTRQEIAMEMRKIEPFVNIPVEYVDVPDGKGKQLIVIVADKQLYSEAPYVFDGKPFYKSESTTMPMPQTMYEQMLRHRDSETFHWDSLVAEGYSIYDLDEELIRNVVRMGVANGRLSGSADNEPLESLLGKLKLLKDGKPTNAAVVLFAKDTEQYPQIELRMAYFKGMDKNIFIDNKCESGNFFRLLDVAIAFCFRNLKLGGEIVGLQRKEVLEIPIEALREAIINAFCHRQYERTNGSVSLAIYDDRLEIVNPGKFPPEISPENIKQPHESYPYNKKVAQLLYLCNYLEKWGSGAQRIIEFCNKQNIPEPKWIAKNGTITIVFQRNKKPMDLKSVQLIDKQTVIEMIGGKLAVSGGKLAVSGGIIEKLADVFLFVKNNPNCNSEKVAAMLDRGKSTARNYLHLLTELEMIKPRGTFRDRTYIVL